MHAADGAIDMVQVDIWLGSGEGAMLQLLPQATQQAVTAAWLATLHQRQPSKVDLPSSSPFCSCFPTKISAVTEVV